MFARLSTYQGSPVPTEAKAVTSAAEDILRQISDAPGFRGVYMLVDRTSGKSVSLTLWADEQAMRDSEARGNRIRQEAAEHAKERIVSVERFEVGFAHVQEDLPGS